MRESAKTGRPALSVPCGCEATARAADELNNHRAPEEAKLFVYDVAAQKIEKVKQLAPVAQSLSCTLAQLALAWCLMNPNVSTVITGASKVSQVTENMQALAVVEALALSGQGFSR